MATDWTNKLLDDASRLFEARRYRSALQRVTTVLSVYPDDRDALEIASRVVRKGMGASSSPTAPDEALGKMEWFDTRLDAIYCCCDAKRCHKQWPTNYYKFSRYPAYEITNPAGGRCDSCARTFCRYHAKSTRRYDFACPRCRQPLDPVPPPNGRDSEQLERLNQRLVHVKVVAEGKQPPSGDYLTSLFRTVSPDVFEDDPTIAAANLPRFDGAEEFMMAYVTACDKDPAYRTPDYDVQLYHGEDADGRGNWVIAKVFETKPKVVDPDAAEDTT